MNKHLLLLTITVIGLVCLAVKTFSLSHTITLEQYSTILTGDVEVTRFFVNYYYRKNVQWKLTEWE